MSVLTPSAPGTGLVPGGSGPAPGEVPPGPEPGRSRGSARSRRSRWTARLLGVAATAWLLFTLLHLCLSGRVWWWVLPELVPPIAFLLVPVLLLGVALGLRSGRRRVLATAGPALVAALVCGLTGLTVPRGGGSEAVAGDLRVVSWNTEYWDQGSDPDQFYAYLHAHPADVYLLQEYLLWDDPAHRVQRLDDLARLHREFPGYRILVAGELVTLSRLPVTARYQLGTGDRQAGEPGPAEPWFDQFTADKVLRTDVRLPDGRAMSLYNVHVPVQLDVGLSPAGGAFYDFMRERHQARSEVYRALADDVGTNPNPALVAGDFNTSASMAELRSLRGAVQPADLSGGGPYPTSWALAGARLWRLDWTFVSDSVRTDRYRLRSPQGLSDHRLQDLQVSVRSSG